MPITYPLANRAFPVSLGSTAKQQQTMLEHLITIGTDLNRSAWGDHLQVINGIGPAAEAILTSLGVTSFKELAQMDEAKKATIKDAIPFGNVDRWIVEARDRDDHRTMEGDRERRPEKTPGDVQLHPRVVADLYLTTVKEVAGLTIDGRGVVEQILRGREDGDKTARSIEHDLFDAPTEHDGCRRLVQALKALVRSSDHNVVRIPALDGRQLDKLKSAYHLLGNDQSLGGDRALDAAKFDEINLALESAGIELRPTVQYDSIVAAQQARNEARPGYEIQTDALGHVNGTADTVLRPDMGVREQGRGMQPAHLQVAADEPSGDESTEQEPGLDDDSDVEIEEGGAVAAEESPDDESHMGLDEGSNGDAAESSEGEETMEAGEGR